ncbi:MAG: hypothetical protein JW873_02270 [Candidatus Saganbacteria bacterium]|nr:hypothetical protein [Candidatus Saganbacteria bacterium]
MKRPLFFLLLTSYFFLLTAPVFAGFISLKTTITLKPAGNKLKIGLAARNAGNEPAYNVEASVAAAGREVRSQKLGELPVGATYRAEESLPRSLPVPGTYPLTIILRYTDANQYPFSPIIVRTFDCGQATTSPLFGLAQPLTFTNAGKLAVTFKNPGERWLKARVTLLAPGELTVAEPVRTLDLAPRGEQKVEFAVSNFSALPGSVYQLYAAAEFDAAGRHYTALVPATVKLGAEHRLLGLDPLWLGAGLVLLTALFAAAQFIRGKK